MAKFCGIGDRFDRWTHIDSSLFGGWMQDLVVRDLEVDTYNDGETITTELQPYYLGVQGLAYGWEGLFRYRPSDQPWWGWIFPSHLQKHCV